ncbi:iron-siderophore ABC transporter substrate-binding protein [Microlunatus soli]|uniref:Iron complex transport system substrate-binding protein n=1 Tax=Microlunatus soli TaxID=630515 RepID=A0A1H1Y7Y5_9ACTN|nr:iron-siderophore ABC transporter substrate-binding protein [Microlunatus soli]SDT17514.1 iron complex transport system substrate-binding protein [Microlunatus soli]
MDRRTLLTGLGAAGLGATGLALVGCADSGESAADGATPTGAAEPGALPVTIEHQFGSTTVKSAPQRIVCVGLKEQDDLLALGLMPVGATQWLDFGEGKVLGSWAQDKARSDSLETDITVLSQDDGIQFEKIAGLRPDLILALYAGLEQSDYDKLSRLAPVVAAPKGLVGYGIGWQQQALTVGKAVGRPKQMRRLVDDVKTKISKAADGHPEFAGSSGLVATLYEGIYLYGPQDPRSRLISELGFELPAGLAEITGKEFGASISTEKIELIDTDALIWLVSPSNGDFKKLSTDKLYRKLRVVREGRAITIEALSDLDNAFNFCTVLSIPFVLTDLVPKLAAAVDGDPSTGR